MKLRRLNSTGLELMGAFLDSLTSDVPGGYPSTALIDQATSEQLSVSIDVDENRQFSRRFDAASYLYECLSPIRMSAYQHLERDQGMWSWLSLLWFQHLCSRDENGQFRPRERARWIPVLDDARRFYRHLLLGPYLIYRTHADSPSLIEPVLSNKMEVATGEVFRTIVETQQFISSAPVVDLFGRLFYDRSKKKLIRGAGTKGPGGARRLGDLLSQLDRTYDLHTIKTDDLLGLLPGEFRRANSRAT